jgi:RimJ/RimL family protein N-acetyltransferase
MSPASACRRGRGTPAHWAVTAGYRENSMSFIIETPRLGMREIREHDAEDFFALCTDPRVMRYVVDEEAPRDVAEMRQRVIDYPDYAEHGFGRWACIHKETNRFMGFTGLKRLDDFDGQVDLGYRFFPEFWGQGYATESGLPCVRYGHDVLGLERIIGLVLPDNVASARVLVKCGMSFERLVTCGAHEAALYAVETSNTQCHHSNMRDS